jgi:Ca-activated chloride channel family protein
MRSASIFLKRWLRASAICAATLGVSAFIDSDSPTAAQSSAPGSVFRSETDLVVLQVSVVDPLDQFVPDLGQADFAVFEEGVRQNVSLFGTAAAPLDLTLLIDTSSSMISQMSFVETAAVNFVRTLRPQDRATIVMFDQRVRVAQSATNDLAKLESAIRHASSRGQTALYEALYVALRLSRSQQSASEVRRQAVVVLSDGSDNASRLSFEDVIAEARRNAAVIYTVLPPAPETFFGEDRSANRRFEMRALATETGGRTFSPLRIQELSDVYGGIAHELSQQYLLAYVPTVFKEGFRRVSVQVGTRPSLRARTRSGYFVNRKSPRVGP